MHYLLLQATRGEDENKTKQKNTHTKLNFPNLLDLLDNSKWQWPSCISSDVVSRGKFHSLLSIEL